MRFIFSLSLLFLFLHQVRCQTWDQVNRESITFYQEGKFDQAILTGNRALELAERFYGKNSTQYCTSLSNKGYAQMGAGDFNQALDNFRQAAALTFKIYALPHLDQMEALIEVAKTFEEIAVYDSADYYLDRAQYIYNVIPQQNKAHYDTMLYPIWDAFLKLTGLHATLYYSKGQPGKAAALLEGQILMIKTIYPDNYLEVPDYQTTINNLSTYYIQLKDFQKAKTYALEYKSLIDDSRPLEKIQALQNLGSIYSNMERYDSALVFWNEALGLLRSGGYEKTYLHTVVLNNMGELYINILSYDSAISYLQQSIKIQRSREALQPSLYQTTLYNLAESYYWSENYAAADSVYTDLTGQLLDDIVHNFTYLSDDEKISFYRNQVSILDSYKAFALSVTGIFPIQHTDTPYINKEIAGRLYDLQLTTKAIILHASKRMRDNILNSGDTTLISVYKLWEDRKAQLARALVNGKMSGAELQGLKETIEKNEKWLTTNSRSFKSGFETEEVTWQQVQHALKPGEAAVELIRIVDGLLYFAAILTPETTDQPVLALIQSTKSKHLDDQFYRNYYNSIQLKLEDTLSYITYWKPVADSIKAHMPGHVFPDRVYVSNDGIYNQINLNTLKNPDTGNYILDETDIVILTNTKELVSNETPVKNNHRSAALFGQPQFSETSGGNGGIADLPGTGVEVRLINQSLMKAGWSTQLFTSENATEEQVKKLNEPTVLHLASHGFFNPAKEGSEISLAETMIRSGIVLAGAADSVHKDDDGLLTAYEMLGLNLDSTQLVVLSACETARGVENHGEGVYGIQRALRVAGAHNMIMSLWKVDDAATQELMVDFYQRWVKSNDIRNSFREAQMALRKKYPESYFWGAFVLAGR